MKGEWRELPLTREGTWPPGGANADYIVDGVECAVVRHPPYPKDKNFPWFADARFRQYEGTEHPSRVIGHFYSRDDAMLCAEVVVAREMANE